MAAALFIAGCGSSGSTATVAQPSNSVPAEASPSVPKPEKLVTIHESEFKLDPAQANGGDQGIVKVKVVNDGKIPHSLSVDGPNGRVDLDGNVDPGQSATFEVDLDKPGTYTMWCPLDHHRAKGMSGTITVGGSTPARGSENQSTTVTQSTPTQTQTQTQKQTQTQTTTQTQTQTRTKTVTSPTTTKTSTTPTATTGNGSGGNGY